jgi:hypothetical protein
VELVLVRPDFYVFGGGALQDADELVLDLADRLALLAQAGSAARSRVPSPGL